MKYLDPKADMTFKKVFGEHEDLVISFLNSLLPFESEDELIKSVEYLNPELVPLNPLKKDSIVDVRCKDSRGRQFIVEMQMMWTSEYKQRVLFNAQRVESVRESAGMRTGLRSSASGILVEHGERYILGQRGLLSRLPYSGDCGNQ